MRDGSEALVPVIRFDTDDFAIADRHDAWLNRDWPAIGPLFDTCPTQPFYNRSDRFSLGALSIHVAQMGAQSYRRSERRACSDAVDHLMITVMLSGSAVGDADGLEVGVGAGGASFVDLSMPHAHESTDSHTVLLTLPRMLAAREGLDVRALHGATLTPVQTFLLRSHLASLHAALPTVSVASAPRLERSVLDLLCAAVEDADITSSATTGPRDGPTLFAAQRLIANHLRSPSLDLRWLCARLGVSRSTLYRLFEDHGGIARYIRDQRLDRIAEALSTPARSDRTADLAEHWGFNDAAQLTRAFRNRFGMTPGEYRAAAIRENAR